MNLGFFNLAGIVAACSAAHASGLLEALYKGAATPAEFASTLGLDERATHLVLQVLATVDVAAHDGDRYRATPSFVEFVNASPGKLALFAPFAHAPAMLRTGTPLLRLHEGEAERERYYENTSKSLGDIFFQAARSLAAKLPVAPQRILDIGCGSGVWSLALAEVHERAHVTGLDWPLVVPLFTQLAAKMGLSERATACAADMATIQFDPGAFDLVIIANVMRLEPPDKARSLLERAARWLAPGGHILIVDALHDGSREREQVHAVYALYLGLRTSEGTVHSPATLRGWFAEMGFSGISAFDIEMDGPIGSLLAQKPS